VGAYVLQRSPDQLDLRKPILLRGRRGGEWKGEREGKEGIRKKERGIKGGESVPLPRSDFTI